jgi:hypothetical protein
MRKESGPWRNGGGSHTAFVTPNDQKRLNALFSHERALYNGLIDIFESRTRVFPQMIFDISATERKLFAEVAARGIKWKDVDPNPLSWPTSLHKVRQELTESKKGLKINGQMDLMLQELGKLNYSVLPNTKRMMVNTVMEFYQHQADIIKDPQHSELIEVAYRVPPANLTRMDEKLKRHCQVVRTDVQVKYDNQEDKTLITCPLTINPIVVPGINLNERGNWNVMVVRQESGRYVDYNTPWLVEFKQTNNQYLLKLIDIGSGRVPK